MGSEYADVDDINIYYAALYIIGRIVAALHFTQFDTSCFHTKQRLVGTLPSLIQYCSVHIQVSETCLLAIERIKWLENSKKDGESLSVNPYYSVDPAPPSTSEDIGSLKQTLLNESLPLFERYRALFSLRNSGTKDAVISLAEGMYK